VVSADEARQLGRQVVRPAVEGADGRELGREPVDVELPEAFGSEVLEAVLAEVA